MKQELKGTHTQANLLVAYSGESQAAEKYAIYAAQARKDGYQQVAAFLEETAANERQHAKLWFRLLNGGIAATDANLADAAGGEHYEWSQMYPQFAQAAKDEGFEHIATLMRLVAEIERRHEQRFNALLENLKSGAVFARPEKKVWICRNCGFTIESENAPQMCPVCEHPQGYFELLADNY